MVSTAKEGMTKSTTHGKASNKNVDKFRKKNAQPSQSRSSLRNAEVCKSVVVNDESVEKFAIKDEHLLELRKTQGGHRPVTIKITQPRSFAVKKKSFVEEKKTSPPTQKYVVAKAAPPNAQLKPIEAAPCGPRYTSDGRIIPHSILGSVHDFVAEAIRRNEMKLDSPAAQESFAQSDELIVKKYKRSKAPKKEPISLGLNQENALINWRKRMIERKKIQGYVSQLLDKPIDRLVMSQSLNSYREVKEISSALEKATNVFHGSMEGDRTGCEFWKQTTVVGDPLNGLRTTLTTSQKCAAGGIEHVGKSFRMQVETGEAGFDGESTDARKSWFENGYLRKRVKQLDSVLQDIDPCKPSYDNLEIFATQNKEILYDSSEEKKEEFLSSTLNYESNDDPKKEEGDSDDPLSVYPDVVPPPIIGPSIIFDGIPAYWNGSSDNNKGEVGAVTRVGFECGAGERTLSDIRIKNNGTTVIYYEWKKVAHVSQLPALPQDLIQRFYFNTNEGHILPGDVITIPFVFKCELAGIFTETWEFLTNPAVIGGASLCVVLKGVALLDDSKTVARRREIEEDLAEKDKQHAVQRAVNEIIRGISTPERSSSPLDEYETEEEIFLKKNPRRFYDFESVERLKKIYAETLPPNTDPQDEWDFSLVGLLACVTTLADENKRQTLMKEMNEIVSRLSFPVLRPNVNKLYSIARKHWMQYFDSLLSCSMMIRASMELPEEVMTEPIKIPEIYDKKPKGRRQTVYKDSKDEKGKKGKVATPKDAKDKDRPKSTPKPRGSPKVDRDELKRSKPRPKVLPFVSAPDPLEPEVREKYSEKIYPLAYNLMAEMIDNMAAAFDDVKRMENKKQYF